MPQYNTRILTPDNAVVIFQQKRSNAAIWHYRIRLPHIPNAMERKSTRTFDEREAEEIAKKRFAELAARDRMGFSPFNKPFIELAEEYIDYLEADAASGTMRGTRLRTTESKKDRYTSVLRNYLIPYFKAHQPEEIHDGVWVKYFQYRKKQWEKENTKEKQLKRKKVNGKYKRRYGAPKSPTQYTTKRDQIVMRQVYRLALKNRRITQNQLPSFDLQPTPNDKRVSFTEAEYQSLGSSLSGRAASTWSHLKNGTSKRKTPLQIYHGKLLRYYVHIMCNSGLRPGESQQLQWKDYGLLPTKEKIDGETVIKNYPKIELQYSTDPNIKRYLKTGPRTVVANPKCIGWFKQLKELQTEAFGVLPKPDDFIWRGYDGKLVRRFQESFQNVLEHNDMLYVPSKVVQGKIMRRSIYVCRHFYITRALKREVNIYALSKNCGTSVEMITNFYSDVVSTDIAKQLTKMAREYNE
jgi:hypothetical protein